MTAPALTVKMNAVDQCLKLPRMVSGIVFSKW